jgi:hypothetical protein
MTALRDTWHLVRGTDLEAISVRPAEIDDYVQDCEAIYIWRRHFNVPVHALASSSAMCDWVRDYTLAPVASTGVKNLSHYARMLGIEFGGGGLTLDKLETLREFVEGGKQRRFLAAFLESLSNVSPVLYVGETNDLRRRLIDHLGGRTQFCQQLEVRGTPWTDVDVLYYPIGKPRPVEEDGERIKARRTLLELLATRLLVAPLVTRPG